MLRLTSPLLLALACLLTVAGCQSSSTTLNANNDPAAWQAYLARSEYWQTKDRDAINTELTTLGQKEATRPEPTNRFGFNINQPASWYNTDEGRRVADIVLSFQTPSGGWSKGTHMAHQVRQPGEAFGYEARYIPTFDNSATTVQLRVLARAYSATGNSAYRDAFLKGIGLIIEAQYPNGGWPQNFPLVGGYHDYITFNDEVMENNLSLLHDTWRAQDEFEFVPEPVRRMAHATLEKGLQAVLDTQVNVAGKRTLWGGQHDVFTLEPRQARAYEMAALASAESVSLIDFLMDLELPSPEIIDAVHSAVDWYEKNKIIGYTWTPGDAHLTANTNAPPMWARFAEVGTNRPLFGDRDGSIHHEIAAVSEERRRGYRWYTDTPNQVLAKYADWSQRFPR